MRIERWATALNNAIDAERAKDFEWGLSDCSLFVADCVNAMTGVDWAADFRGHYSTAKGSLLALRKYGKGTLYKTMDHYFARHTSILMARRGDVVVMESEIGQCLGICIGATVAFRSPDGVVFMPLTKCVAAWVID